jgi:hypothetical protein
MTSNNPLRQYFRQPAIYIKLPSQGNYYPPGTLDMPLNKELPVFPMTAIDEITYRTPDALFNGQAVVNVIQSCLPNIKDAWSIPAIDLDTILVAIRVATYGHQMDFSTTCPKCNNDEEYGIDLRTVLDSIRAPDYSQPIKQGDVEIYFKPMTYKNMSDNNRRQFDEQRLFQNINLGDGNPDMAQINAVSAALKKMTEMTVDALAQSILTIKTPSAIVTELEFIQEFMKNCDRGIFNRIQDYIIEHKQQAELQPLNISCKQCSNEYSQQFTLDMSNFFDRAS